MRHLYLIFFSLLFTKAFAQHPIAPYPLCVTTTKTTNLIFPYGIRSVDHGTRDVLVQQAKGVDNVLQLKAARADFPSTNLSVITMDGKFYSFVVSYAVEPLVLNLSFGKDSAVRLAGLSMNTAAADSGAALMGRQKSFLHTRTRTGKMQLALHGVYISKRTLWFVLKLNNRSLIDFDPAYTRFFTADLHHATRTAVQQEDLVPLYKTDTGIIAGDSGKTLVFAFPEFTIPSGKHLVCEISEPAGGRLLLLRVPRRLLLKARAPAATFIF